MAASLERLGYHLEGWAFDHEGLKSGKEHGCAIANFENGISNAEIGNAAIEDRISNLEDRAFENYGAIPEITTEITDRDQQRQQQPVSDYHPVKDRISDEKDVVAADDTPEIISAQKPVPQGLAQCDIQELIDFARDRPHEILLSKDYAREIVRRAGNLSAAEEKIEVASAYIAKERKAGREINSMKGVLNRILQMDTGGIKLGHAKADVERRERLAKKEEKYRPCVDPGERLPQPAYQRLIMYAYAISMAMTRFATGIRCNNRNIVWTD